MVRLRTRSVFRVNEGRHREEEERRIYTQKAKEMKPMFVDGEVQRLVRE